MLAVSDEQWHLIVRAAQRRCALRLEEVGETMRPLSIAAVRDAPVFVRGLSLIRGESVPVVDLGLLLTGTQSERAGRVVTLRLGKRTIALLVDQVIGIRSLDRTRTSEAIPLLGAAANDVASALGSLDAELLVVLRAGRVLSEEEWDALQGEAQQAGAGQGGAGQGGAGQGGAGQ